MLAALFEAGANDAEQIKSGLYATKGFPGVTGTVAFDADGEVTKPIEFVQVRNGQFVPLDR
jgi:branched-chain amino acid transport system substrate-binding protein